MNFLPPAWDIRARVYPHGMAVSLQDVQNQVPTLHVSLSRVGVTNVEKVIRITAAGRDTLYSARLDCFVDLGPRQKGAHMSRFEEVVNDAIGEVILGESALRAETLAQHIAEKVRDRQGARRAEVHLEARYPEHKPAPHSGILHAGDLHAARRRRGQRGGHAPAQRRHRPGHDRLPVRADARAGERARAAARRTASARTRSSASSRPCPSRRTTSAASGTLYVGCPEGCDTDIDARQLLAIVENSMSSEIYELMKRSDEGAVVEKAHRRPRFVEDCVREMIRGVVDELPELRDDAFVSARQENLETIHQHNVVADRYGLLGELRHELASGEHSAQSRLDARLARRPATNSVAPALATHDHRDRRDLARAEALVQHDPAGQRGDRGLERHEHAEDRRREPPQRLELERVGQHRGGERDDQRRAEQAGLQRARRPRRAGRPAARPARRRPSRCASPEPPGKARPVRWDRWM